MTAEPLPALCTGVPGAPRTETQTYRFPPSRPIAPSPLDCTTEDLLRLSIEAGHLDNDLHALLGSPAHVRAILNWAALSLEPQLRLAIDQREAAQGIALALEKRLHEELAASARLIDMLTMAHQESVTLRHRLHAEQEAGLMWQQQCARLATENGHLMTSHVDRVAEIFDMQARLDAAARTITGQSYVELTAQLNDEVRGSAPDLDDAETVVLEVRP